MNMNERVEKLAAQEHEHWMRWAKSLMFELKELTKDHMPFDNPSSVNCSCKTCQRIKRWESMFVPYVQLTEAQKEQDRKEVREHLAFLSTLGCVWLAEDQSYPVIEYVPKPGRSISDGDACLYIKTTPELLRAAGFRRIEEKK